MVAIDDRIHTGPEHEQTMTKDRIMIERMTRHYKGRFGRVASLALIAMVAMLLTLPSFAQVGRSGLEIKAVDEEGNPVPNLGLLLVGQGETASAEMEIETNRRGQFKNRFLSSGMYFIKVQNPDEHYIKEAEVDINDPRGILLKEYSITVHPVRGMDPIPIQGGQITDVTLVVTDAAVRRQLVQQLEQGAVADEVAQLVQLYNENQLEAALQLGNQIMEQTTSELPDVLHLMGMTHTRLDQHDEAEPLLRRAIEIAPEDPQFKASLGTMLLDKARAVAQREEDARAEFTEAEEWLSLAVSEMDSVPVPLLVNQSIALEGSGKPQAAIEVMERIADMEPDNLTVRFRMAALLRNLGQPDRALEILDTLPEVDDPRAVDTLFNIGLTFYNEESYESAIAALTRAVKFAPDHALVHRLLGRTYYSMGQNEKALEHLQRFLELEPDHPEAPMEQEMVDYLEKVNNQ